MKYYNLFKYNQTFYAAKWLHDDHSPDLFHACKNVIDTGLTTSENMFVTFFTYIYENCQPFMRESNLLWVMDANLTQTPLRPLPLELQQCIQEGAQALLDSECRVWIGISISAVVICLSLSVFLALLCKLMNNANQHATPIQSEMELQALDNTDCESVTVSPSL